MHFTRIIRRHMVRMHLRESWASHMKEQSYGSALTKYRYRGLLPPELPVGYTWVIPHERGRYEVARTGAG